MSDKFENASRLSLTEIFTLIFYISLLALIIRGCAPIFKDIAFPHLAVEKDIKELLRKHQITNPKVNCSATATSRSAKCIFTEISQPLKLFIAGLNLRDFKAFEDPESVKNLRSLEKKDEFRTYHYRGSSYLANLATYDKPHTCGSLKAFNDPQLVKVYGNLDRSSELVIPGGGTFEHFFLFHRLDTNEACIHFTYAYG